MTELTTYQPATSTDLTIADEQGSFTDMQVQALRHIGVDSAGPGDLAVFFHVVKRTGLDPFAKQIYMIARQGKQTIQTGIDGYRLIGRRAADAARVRIAVGQPEWAREDGQWMPLWSAKWGEPLAARVTIHRDGEPFTAVAMFDEYKQTKRDGGLTSMWQQRPAGQLAKCAEALAWRMAFPQDLAGIYTDDEMGPADSGRPAVGPGRAALVAAVAEPTPVAGEELASPAQVTSIYASMRDLGYDRDGAKAVAAGLIGRDIESMKGLTKGEASTVIDRAKARIAEQQATQETAEDDGDDAFPNDTPPAA